MLLLLLLRAAAAAGRPQAEESCSRRRGGPGAAAHCRRGPRGPGRAGPGPGTALGGSMRGEGSSMCLVTAAPQPPGVSSRGRRPAPIELGCSLRAPGPAVRACVPTKPPRPPELSAAAVLKRRPAARAAANAGAGRGPARPLAAAPRPVPGPRRPPAAAGDPPLSRGGAAGRGGAGGVQGVAEEKGLPPRGPAPAGLTSGPGAPTAPRPPSAPLPPGPFSEGHSLSPPRPCPGSSLTPFTPHGAGRGHRGLLIIAPFPRHKIGLRGLQSIIISISVLQGFSINIPGHLSLSFPLTRTHAGADTPGFCPSLCRLVLTWARGLPGESRGSGKE